MGWGRESEDTAGTRPERDTEIVGGRVTDHPGKKYYY